MALLRQLSKSELRLIYHAAKLSKQMGNPDPIEKIRAEILALAIGNDETTREKK